MLRMLAQMRGNAGNGFVSNFGSLTYDMPVRTCYFFLLMLPVYLKRRSTAERMYLISIRKGTVEVHETLRGSSLALCTHMDPSSGATAGLAFWPVPKGSARRFSIPCPLLLRIIVT